MTATKMAEEIKAIVSAAVGGARYGVKIRLPHALVMTMLFRQDQPISKKIATILKLSRDHAISLASFAAIYKVCHTEEKLCCPSPFVSTPLTFVTMAPTRLSSQFSRLHLEPLVPFILRIGQEVHL